MNKVDWAKEIVIQSTDWQGELPARVAEKFTQDIKNWHGASRREDMGSHKDHTMTDPAQIARSLSEAQRRAIRGAARAIGSRNNIMVLPLYRDAGALAKSLVNIGLAGYSSRGAVLTKLGKSVLAELEKMAT